MDTAAIELRVADLLAWATRLAVGLLAVGVVLLLAAGRTPLDAGLPLDLARIPGDLAALRPDGFLWAGVVVAVASPAARVALAAVGFARIGATRRAVLGLAVLAVIAAGVVAGLISG